MAVNYKTIVQIRGETYILFFMSILLYLFLKTEKNNFEFKIITFLGLGITIGLLALSRQWAFLLFPGFFILIFFINKYQKKKYFNLIFSSFFVGFIFSSWFYFRFFRYGSFTSFNKEHIGFSFLISH